MYVFINKKTREVEGAGDYETEEDALMDFENWDKPRGRYMVNNETGKEYH